MEQKFNVDNTKNIQLVLGIVLKQSKWFRDLFLSPFQRTHFEFALNGSSNDLAEWNKNKQMIRIRFIRSLFCYCCCLTFLHHNGCTTCISKSQHWISFWECESNRWRKKKENGETVEKSAYRWSGINNEQ